MMIPQNRATKNKILESVIKGGAGWWNDKRTEKGAWTRSQKLKLCGKSKEKRRRKGLRGVWGSKGSKHKDDRKLSAKSKTQTTKQKDAARRHPANAAKIGVVETGSSCCEKTWKKRKERESAIYSCQTIAEHEPWN